MRGTARAVGLVVEGFHGQPAGIALALQRGQHGPETVLPLAGPAAPGAVAPPPAREGAGAELVFAADQFLFIPVSRADYEAGYDECFYSVGTG